MSIVVLSVQGAFGVLSKISDRISLKRFQSICQHWRVSNHFCVPRQNSSLNDQISLSLGFSRNFLLILQN